MSDAGNEFTLDKELTFNSVVRQRLQLRRWLLSLHPSGSDSSVIINFKNIQRSDSAGLALLIEILRMGKQLKRAIFFKNVPSNLLAMANFCGLSSLFEGKQWIN